MILLRLNAARDINIGVDDAFILAQYFADGLAIRSDDERDSSRAGVKDRPGGRVKVGQSVVHRAIHIAGAHYVEELALE